MTMRSDSFKYISKVKSFPMFLIEHKTIVNRKRCPCKSCNNMISQKTIDVVNNIICNEIVQTYIIWDIIVNLICYIERQVKKIIISENVDVLLGHIFHG